VTAKTGLAGRSKERKEAYYVLGGDFRAGDPSGKGLTLVSLCGTEKQKVVMAKEGQRGKTIS